MKWARINETWYKRQAPARVGLLALLDTPARTEARKVLIEQARGGAFKGVTRRALEMYVYPDRVADAGPADAVLAMTARVGQDAFLSQQAAIMGRPDSLPGLPGIACPTLVLCGRQDGPTPVECHKEIAAAIPGARLIVIESSDHPTPVERPLAESLGKPESPRLQDGGKPPSRSARAISMGH